jgi:acetyl-CoA acetyltransferase
MGERQPVVVSAVRTPRGKQGGVFAETGSEELSVPVVEQLTEETGIEPTAVDDVQWECANQVDEQSNNIVRVSQQRACAATEDGKFEDENHPIETDDGEVTEDEGLRPETTRSHDCSRWSG